MGTAKRLNWAGALKVARRWIGVLIVATLLCAAAMSAGASPMQGTIRRDLGVDSIDIFATARDAPEERIGTFSAGMQVTILRTEGSWYVIDFMGRDGYVRTDAIALDSGSGQQASAPQTQSAPEPVIEYIPEPVPEPIPDPIPDPVPDLQDEQVIIDQPVDSWVDPYVDLPQADSNTGLSPDSIEGLPVDGPQDSLPQNETIVQTVPADPAVQNPAPAVEDPRPENVQGEGASEVIQSPAETGPQAQEAATDPLEQAGAAALQTGPVEQESALAWGQQRATIDISSNNAQAPLYKTADTTTVLGWYNNGTSVIVLDRGIQWTLIQTPDGRQGYMPTGILRFSGIVDPSPTSSAYINLPTGVSHATLYRYSNTYGGSLGSYPNGQQVDVISWGQTWTQVRVDGRTGYIQSQYLTVYPPITPPATTGEYAQVNNPSAWETLNLREQPNTTSRILGQYHNGTTVWVTQRGNTWCRVEVNGLQGYMMTAYLRFGMTPPDPGPGPIPGPIGSYAVVANQNPRERLNLRVAPTVNSQSLGLYYNGTVVQVLERGSVWCRVWVDGIEGYMMTYYLAFGDGTQPIPPTPTPPIGAVMYATVNNPNPRDALNLRAAPTINSQSLGLYYNGTSVSVYEYDALWCRVQVAGKNGYMMTAYLSFSNRPNDPPSGSGSSTYAVVKNPGSNQRLNLREYRSQSSRSLGQYYNGTRVRILAYDAVWCHVEVDGKIGYMMTQFLSFGGTSVNPTVAVVNNPATTQGVKLYSFPNSLSQDLGTYYNGVAVQVVEYGADWCRVSVSGVTGYMQTRLLRFR